MENGSHPVIHHGGGGGGDNPPDAPWCIFQFAFRLYARWRFEI